MTAETVDGRNLRKLHNRTSALDACRRLMLAGDFRPSMKAVAKAGRMSVRSVFEYFGSVEVLYREALDIDTSQAIAELIFAMGMDLHEQCRRSVHAAVFGAVPPPLTMETRS